MNWCGIKLKHLIPQRQDVNNLKICSQKSGILETNSDHVASFVWIQDLSLEPYHGGIRLVHLLQSIGYFVLHFHMNNEWRIRLICVNMYMNRITVWHVHEQNYRVDEVEYRDEEKERRCRRGLCNCVSGLNSQKRCGTICAKQTSSIVNLPSNYLYAGNIIHDLQLNICII